MKLSYVLSIYNSSVTIEHKATVIRWAKRVLTSKEMEWFGFSILKTKDFDLVLNHYRHAA